MKILIDTDILLDVVLDRAPHADVSGQILDWAECHPGSSGVAWHSLVNIAYMVKGDARSFLGELLSFVIVPGTSTESARQALELPVPDLEDAFQVAAATQFGAEHIIARNVKDFRRSPVPAVTPAQFLKDLV